MKALTFPITVLFATSLAHGSQVCPSQTLNNYIDNGFYACTEANGNLTVEFNHDLLPSYVGLNVLSSNNSAADPSAINVVPGNPGLEFNSSAFTESSSLLSAQTELVHFLLDAAPNDVTSTTLTLNNVQTSAGFLGLGTGLAVGQELVCVGGAFTTLPTGLVTSVANGLLGTGAYGCNGTALVGTAATSSGLLNVLTGLIGLPDLTGLTDSATIQLSPVNGQEVDVIKIQALVSVTGGSASDSGFGNTYTLSQGNVGNAPEPGTSMFMLAAGVLLAGNRYFARWLGMGRKRG